MHRLLIYFGLIFICAIFSASSEVGAGLVVTKEEVHKTVRDYVLGAISDFGGDVQVSVRWRGKLELTGKGEVKLSERALQNFMWYLRGDWAERKKGKYVPAYFCVLRRFHT